MTFDDQSRLKQAALASGEAPPEPKPGDRICEACEPRVALVLDLSKAGYEYRCPQCGNYEEWFGLRFLPKVRSTDGPSAEGNANLV